MKIPLNIDLNCLNAIRIYMEALKKKIMKLYLEVCKKFIEVCIKTGKKYIKTGKYLHFRWQKIHEFSDNMHQNRHDNKKLREKNL